MVTNVCSTGAGRGGDGVGGLGVQGKSACYPLNFTVNVKLLSNKIVLFSENTKGKPRVI